VLTWWNKLGLQARFSTAADVAALPRLPMTMSATGWWAQ